MSKRMVLVDERVYESMHSNMPSTDDAKLKLFQQMLNNEMWKRSPTETTKSHLSNSLESQLVSTDVADDVKAKLYQKTLKRFLDLKQQMPELEPTTLNVTTDQEHKKVAKPQPRQQIPERRPKIVQWEPSALNVTADQEPKKEIEREPKIIQWESLRQSKRQRKKWTKYDNE